jgi:transposase
MSTITIGVDLAKSVFSVCEVDGSGRALRRQDRRREAFSVWLAQVPADTIVAMEACSGLHHLARRCLEHGLQLRLMAAQLVKPYRKSQHGKNDRNDAEAIATAARQGNMHFVPIKNIDPQARLSWHRVREGYKAKALAISNRLRGLLAEVGIVMTKSDKALRRVLADLQEHTALPAQFREQVCDLATHWEQVRVAFDACDARIEGHARNDQRCVRLRGIAGIGAITADAMVASLGKAQEFRNGRQLSAWLGMVPRQYSSVDTRKRPHPNNCGYAHWRDGYRIAPKLRFNAR